MIDTLFLYILILILNVLLTLLVPSKIFKKTQNVSLPLYILTLTLPVLLFTCFWGLRFNVGADYSSYVYIFYHLPERFEVGFKILVSFLRTCNFSHVSLFIVLSLLTIITIYYLGRNTNKLYTSLLVYYFYTTSLIFFSLNGMRQMVAMCFIFVLVKLMSDDSKVNIIKLSVIPILAYTFHKTSIIPLAILLPLYLLKPIKINKYVLILILLVVIVSGTSIFQYINFDFSFLLETEYSNYLSRVETTEEVTYSSGLGAILDFLLCTFIIYNQEIFYKNKNKSAYYFYIFFLLGIILSKVFIAIPLSQRLFIYFSSTKFIILSLITYHFYQKRNMLIVAGIVIFLLLLYINSILNNNSNVVPYQSIPFIFAGISL